MLNKLISVRAVSTMAKFAEPSVFHSAFSSRFFATNEKKKCVQANTTTLVADDKDAVLQQNYKNPFNQDTAHIPEIRAPVLSDEERQRRLKIFQLEVDIAYQEGRRVPKLDFFQEHHWDNILSLPSKSARLKYYSFLWQLDMKKQSQNRKKRERAELILERKEQQKLDAAQNNHIIYALSHTSMFLRIYDSTINHWQNNRLTRAMQFAPKIVLDCSYDDYMTKREANYAAKQLMLTFAENRAHDDPFDIHYCNVNVNSVCIESLRRYIPTMFNPEFPMNVHAQCFTKMFPKENLVYLTPHCRTDLEAYNPDDVYIIGAMVDKINNEPLSLAKAKKLGLRMARLPLDRYLQWNSGSGKSLTLNHMVKIMLDLKCTGDWTKALQHVPRRKIVDLELDEEQSTNKLRKHASKFNVRIDRIHNFEKELLKKDFNNKVHSFKAPKEFDIDNWGSTKKT